MRLLYRLACMIGLHVTRQLWMTFSGGCYVSRYSCHCRRRQFTKSF